MSKAIEIDYRNEVTYKVSSQRLAKALDKRVSDLEGKFKDNLNRAAALLAEQEEGDIVVLVMSLLDPDCIEPETTILLNTLTKALQLSWQLEEATRRLNLLKVDNIIFYEILEKDAESWGL